jgi:predicted O-methyltransferase YrrM
MNCDQFPADDAEFFKLFQRLGERHHSPEERSLIVAGLIEAWGNRLWSAWGEYLEGCLEAVASGEGPILECGAGLSSLIIADQAARHGRRLWTLEESGEWTDRINQVAERLGLANLRVIHGPMRDYQGFRWYDAPLEQLPDAFGLVACDGPAARQDPYSRFGLVPVLGERLAAGATILLDDGARTAEQEIAERWARTLKTRVERVGKEKPYLRLRIPT